MIMAPKLTLSDARLVIEGPRPRRRRSAWTWMSRSWTTAGTSSLHPDERGAHYEHRCRHLQGLHCGLRTARDPRVRCGGGAGGPAFGIHVSNQGRFMIVGGGLPILSTESSPGCRLQFRLGRTGPRGGAGGHRPPPRGPGRRQRRETDKRHVALVCIQEQVGILTRAPGGQKPGGCPPPLPGGRRPWHAGARLLQSSDIRAASTRAGS